jgi:2-alkyl-3-oxoalkanoate reductase
MSTPTTLVTGATGLLGGAVTTLLLERGRHVRALVQPHENDELLVRDGVEVQRGDLRDVASLRKAVTGVDCLLHCAARTGPWGPQREYDAINVIGLRTILESALTAGVRRIVHVSSVAVHGNDLGGAGDETSPLRIEPNPYSRTKVIGEQFAARLIRTAQAPITIVRPGVIYGARDRNGFGRLVEKIRQGRMLQIGAGGNVLPLIYVTDAARGILLAAEAEHAVGRTYLLVNDEPVTQRRYLTTIARALGVAPPRRRIPYRLAIALGALAETAQGALRPAAPPPLTRFGVTVFGGNSCFSIARARTELGFDPQIDLDEGVRLGVAWYREWSAAKRPAGEVAEPPRVAILTPPFVAGNPARSGATTNLDVVASDTEQAPPGDAIASSPASAASHQAPP